MRVAYSITALLVGGTATAGDLPTGSADLVAEPSEAAAYAIAPPQVTPEPIAEANYEVGAGDVLAINVYGEETLTGSYAVADSGRIDFPLLGPVNVAERTPEQIRSLLEEILGTAYLRNPRVSVSVETYGSQPVQVLGAVHQPGVYHIRGSQTVVSMLSEAGGVAAEGVVEVRLNRRGNNSDPIVLDLDALLARGEGDIPVHGGDTLFLPNPLVIYVDGYVVEPGPIPYKPGMTAFQALSAAGGAAKSARLRTAYILRGATRIDVNLRRIMLGRAADVQIQPDDHLVIEESVF